MGTRVYFTRLLKSLLSIFFWEKGYLWIQSTKDHLFERDTTNSSCFLFSLCTNPPPPYTGYFLFHNKEQRKRTSICLLWRVNNKSERNGLCNNCAHGKDVNYIAGYLKFLSFKFVKTFFANLEFREFQNITKIAKVIKFINNKASFVDII